MGALPRWVALPVLALFVALVVAMGAGCSNPTQITLLLASDQCGSGATATSITVGDPPNIESNAPSAFTSNCDDAGTIGSLVLVPSGADDAPVEIRVVLGVGDAGADAMTCLDAPDGGAPAYGPGCIVERRIVSYVPHQNVIVPIEMLGVCDSTTGRMCQPSATCVNGTCVPAMIPDPAACTTTTACMLTGPGADAGLDAPPDDTPFLADVPGSDTPLPDATVDSTVPFDGGSCQPTAGCYMVPPGGWTLAALDPTNMASCPAGFEGSMVVEDPVSTCTYGQCTPDQSPSCSGGTATAGIGGCYIGPASWSAGSCQGLTLAGGSNIKFTPTASVTSCSLPATTPPIAANAQACTNPNASICDGGLCEQTFTAPLKACIETSTADATCPPATPFTAHHIVASSATSSCAAAMCKATASCTGTVKMFTDQGCSQGALTVPADGSCNFTSLSTYQSFEYSPGTQTSTCTPTAPAEAPPNLVGARTFCCVP